jgi:hypothetical protein
MPRREAERAVIGMVGRRRGPGFSKGTEGCEDIAHHTDPPVDVGAAHRSLVSPLRTSCLGPRAARLLLDNRNSQAARRAVNGTATGPVLPEGERRGRKPGFESRGIDCHDVSLNRGGRPVPGGHARAVQACGIGAPRGPPALPSLAALAAPRRRGVMAQPHAIDPATARGCRSLPPPFDGRPRAMPRLRFMAPDEGAAATDRRNPSARWPIPAHATAGRASS